MHYFNSTFCGLWGWSPLKELPPLEDYHLIVDAIFGTGFQPPVKPPAEAIIKTLERTKVPILSVDIPSGLSADSGRLYTPSVKANITVTFQFPKVCHLLHPASKQCGELYVAHIGIPEVFVKDVRREVILRVEPPTEGARHPQRKGWACAFGGW
jgi:hydroxyethylthiazole kinase-like uncharacterized protein yjeF